MKMTATTEYACYQCGWLGTTFNNGDGGTCPTCGKETYEYEEAEYNRCFLTTPEESLVQSFIAACVVMIAFVAGSFLVLTFGKPTANPQAPIAVRTEAR